jgi:hypothetical protein
LRFETETSATSSAADERRGPARDRIRIPTMVGIVAAGRKEEAAA